MLTLLIPLLIVAFIVSRIVRLFTRPFRPYGRHYNPYGYNRSGFGYGRRHRFGGGLMSILALVALDQFFNNRRP